MTSQKPGGTPGWTALTAIKLLKSGTASRTAHNFVNELDAAEWIARDANGYIPRRYDVVRDWIMAVWTQTDDSRLSVLNAHIHKLFHRVQPQCQSPLTPDPRLFIALSESFAALHGTSSLDTSLATTFEIIHQQSTGYQDWLSTQRWSQAWLSVIGNLGDWRGDRQLDTKNVLRAFLTSLSACVGYSLKASQNRKAETEGLFRSCIPYVRLALQVECPRRDIVGTIQSIYLPVSILRDTRSTANILAATRLSLTEPLDTHILPIIFEAKVHALRGSLEATFQQPSSSKLPYEVFLAERLRSATCTSLLDVLSVADDVIDSGSITEQRLALELECWRMIKDSKTYIETEKPWIEVLSSAASRAQDYLRSVPLRKDVRVCAGGPAMELLALLEGLDHSRTHISADSVSACLTASEDIYQPSLALVTALLSYHVITQTMADCMTILFNSVLIAFSTAQAASEADRVYAAITTGPLFDPSLRRLLLGASRRMTSGTERNDALDFSDRLRSLQLLSIPSRRIVGILSRLVSIVSCNVLLPEDRHVIEKAQTSARALLATPSAGSRKRKASAEMSDSMGIGIVGAAIDRYQIRLPFGMTQTGTEVIDINDQGVLPEAVLLRAISLSQSLSRERKHAKNIEAGWAEILQRCATDMRTCHWSGRQAVTRQELQTALLALLAVEGARVNIAFPAYGSACIASIPAARGEWSWLTGLMRDAQVWESSTFRASFNAAAVNALALGTVDPASTAGIMRLALHVHARVLQSTTSKVLLLKARDLAIGDDKTPSPLRRAGQECFAHLLPSAPKATLVSYPSASWPGAEDPPSILLDAPAILRVFQDRDNLSPLDPLASSTDSIIHTLCRFIFEGFSVHKQLISELNESLKQSRQPPHAILTAWLPAAARRPFDQYTAPLQDSFLQLFSVLPEAFHDSANPGSSMRDALSDLEQDAKRKQIERWMGIKDKSAIQAETVLTLCRQNLALATRMEDLDRLFVLSLDVIANDKQSLLSCFLWMDSLRASSAVEVKFESLIGALDQIDIAVAWSQVVDIVQTEAIADARMTSGLLLALTALAKRHPRQDLVPVLKALLPVYAGLVSNCAVRAARWLAMVLGRSSASAVELVLAVQLARRSLRGQTGGAWRVQFISEILLGVTAMLETQSNKLVVMASPLCSLLSECLRHLRTAGNVVNQPEDDFAPIAKAVAKQMSRTLSRLRGLGSVKSREPLPVNSSTAGIFAKHITEILVAYARSTVDAPYSLSPAVRQELESGMWSLCDIVTTAGRVDARGREGEGIGLPYGLGEGARGNAEREVWATLWQRWRRQRYIGRG